ncbi:MAG TPA: hypothetical protein VFC03_20130, partial [Acidimicrobiales bacterium]|nr:hypothetical protein [Acidimicrobiales bacterium]
KVSRPSVAELAPLPSSPVRNSRGGDAPSRAARIDPCAADPCASEAELGTVRRLGVHLGQGFLLGKPESLA